MIEGLKIDVSSAELQEHIQARAAHHEERAEWYEGQVASLREGGLGSGAATNDPISSLEGSAKRHREKTAFFSFLAEHIVPNETYRLTENDLTRLEILSRWF